MLKAGTDSCHQFPVKGRSKWPLGLTLVPTVAAAIMPKCPLCLMGMMSAVGLSYSMKAFWLLPLTLFFLFTAIAALAFQARRRRSYSTFLLGVMAAAIIISGKFYAENNLLIYSGVAILVATSLWSSLSKRKAADKAECEC